MRISLLSLLALPLIFLSILSSCEVETDFVTGNEVRLRFSTDTVAFDTVFTAVGSATQVMKIYNEGDEPVMIDRIRVEDRTGVDFIFNVDGFRGPVAEDVIIWGQDSIFLFVEVTVDPTAPENVSPFIAEDRLFVETGDAQAEIILLAYGQNADYLNDFRSGQFGGIIEMNCDDGIFTLRQDLPTVIYGSLIIEDCILQALEGTRIYVHGGVQRGDPEVIGGNGFFNDGIIFVLRSGSVQFLGTTENPVLLATDRLEERFLDDPAKYQGIILGPGSRNNIIRNTHVLNAINGITIDSMAQVNVEKSVIAYTGGPAIAAYQANVTVENSVFHSNFGNAVQFVKGGTLRMDHTTIANYGVDASGLVLTNFVCDDNDNCLAAPMRSTIRNSIISGSRGSELIFLDIFDGTEPGTFEVNMNNSLVRTNQEFLDSQDGLFADFYGQICRGCRNLTFSDTLFVDLDMDDYQLDSLSVARDFGQFIPELPTDLLGVDRDTDSPDVGAYERVDR
ncbi:MAG: right-handed parallel beta-helix repeat-containing protein [Bacteroidota bacterium]